MNWTNQVTAELSDSVRHICINITQAASSNFGVLLVGSAKTGKTRLMETIISSKFAESSNSVVRIRSRPKTMSAVKTILASINSPQCLAVFVDNLQNILSSKPTELEHKFMSLLLRALRRMQETNNTLILATALPSFDAQVWCDMLRVKRVTLTNPTHDERVAQISLAIVDNLGQAEYIAKRTNGWTRGEINAFLTSILSKPGREIDNMLTTFRKQTSLYQESAIMLADNVTLPKVGGMVKMQSLLDRMVMQSFAVQPTSSSSMCGILLHGESGNGKTLLGLTLGRKVQQNGMANFFCVKCLDLVSKIVGETESNVARMFARARESTPCLLFLDELDALAPRRSEDGDSTSERTFDRVLSVLLVELDGILTKQQHGGGSIVVVASCRAVDCLEPALVRAGRLGTHMLVGPADTVEEKLSVLKACTENMPLQVREDFFAELATKTMKPTETRADIANWCREAAMCALREDVFGAVVKEKHFLNALNG